MILSGYTHYLSLILSLNKRASQNASLEPFELYDHKRLLYRCFLMVDTIAPLVESAQVLSSPAFVSKPLDQDRILAAIDVGTNSVHMVVVRIQPALPAFTIIDREKDTVRLGNFCEKTGNLTEEAMSRCIAALQRCRKVAESLQADDIVAVATSAVREANNGQLFLEKVKEEAGLSLDLISGAEEARRIYLGVLSGMQLQGQLHAMLDIGGGSTELILGDGNVHRFLSSTKVGAVRLNAQLVTTNPMSDFEFYRLQAHVRGMLEPAIDELRARIKVGETLRMIGTSGTIECLAVLNAFSTLGTVPSPLNGYEVKFAEIEAWVERLRRMSFAERLALPEMSPRRAEIVVPGAVILHEAMRQLGVDALTVCECSLREGLVVDWMLSHGLIEDRMQYQKSVRERSVMKTAKKYQVDLPHAERIANFALTLFDQTYGRLHHWGAIEREYLWVAAILHNCGHFISHAAHHKHSYYLIRFGELLGFTELELELIANIARYHRKNPPKKKHDAYRDLPLKQHRKVVDQLSGFLRVAVALDRRRSGAIAMLEASYSESMRELVLNLTPSESNDDCDLERWSLEYKKASFEQEFGVRVRAKLTPKH
jgi:exopolyphosphatase / guanosine-5'-triphosphate,3'-diphosphate pyrophosphatase